ncbi:MAG: thiamine pyrophosphate-dependent enzyme [Alphaproteobacteria bacterium]
MARMTGGQALVKSLRNHGIDTIFGLPGVQLDALYNALYDEGNAIRVIHTRHEQGAAYMAFGYAQSSGRVGTYAVVPGPGLLNTATALATAYACNAPVLAVAGQIPSTAIGRGLGQLHEIPDQLSLIRGLTKWAERIDHPAQAPERVGEAFRQLNTGRVRPVEVEMAPDVMTQEAEVALLDAPAIYEAPEPDDGLVDEAAELLGAAENPLIFVGGGVFGAEAELCELAEMLQAPVVSNRSGRGALSDRHYLAQVYLAGRRLWLDADVVLAVGTRLQPQRTIWGVDDALKVVHIDIDPTEINRVMRPRVGIVGDARKALAALIPAVARRNRRRSSREDELNGLKAAFADELERRLGPQMAYVRALREALPDDGILVDELTQVGYVARVGFPVYRPRTLLSSGYQGTLGFGFASALGAKIANPDRKVLSINGDGGFMYNVQELSSAVKHNIDVVAVVFNDGAFGNVLRMQKELYGGRVIASELRNPDFVRLGESFGVGACRATSPEALKTAIRDAFERAEPSVIEVPMGVTPDPWDWFVGKRVRPANAG